jgi:N-acyl-D-amino-acid deacylase
MRVGGARCAITAQYCSTDAYDLIIRNAMVIEGSGNPWFRAEVALRDGRITTIGRLGTASAGQSIDAAGGTVSPGFIDMHMHSDFPLLVSDRAESKVRQGVTIEVLGERSSAGPVEGGAVDPTKPAVCRYGLTWATVGQYFVALERGRTATKAGSYVAAARS